MEITQEQKDLNYTEEKLLLEMIGGGTEKRDMNGIEFDNDHFTVSLYWKFYADKQGIEYRFMLDGMGFETIEDLGKMVKCLREIWKV